MADKGHGLTLGMRRDQLVGMLAAQLNVGILLQARRLTLRPGDRSYRDNRTLWQDIHETTLRASSLVKLEDFWISEWLPLRPGLACTVEARKSMTKARKHMLTRTRLRELEAEIHHSIPNEIVETLLAPSVTVYDPDGKADMLDSGVGCVRLKPVRLEGPMWFMGATSSTTAHEGIPIALTERDYARYIETIATAGAIQCTLTGRLCFMPRELTHLYNNYDLQTVYLHVEAIKKVRKVAAPSDFSASGAILVDAPTQSRRRESHRWLPGAAAAFVTFYPGRPGSLDTACEWLAETYVAGLLGGRALTDFDELTRRFPDAPFGLDAIIRGTLDLHSAQKLLKKQGIPDYQVNVIAETIKELNFEMTSIQDSRSIHIGDGATVTAPVVVANDIENSFQALAAAGNAGTGATRLVEQLLTAIASASNDLPELAAEQLGRDAHTLAVEVASRGPRVNWCKQALQSLAETAAAVGPPAAAIVEIISKLVELF